MESLIGALLGVLIGVVAAGIYAYERQGASYAEISRLLEADRDAARNEAKVFRNLLFPALARIEKGELPAEAAATPAKASTGAGDRTHPVSRSPLFDKRTPFRVRFKQALAATNTKQKGRDELTAAIQQQIDTIQEKRNA